MIPGPDPVPASADVRRRRTARAGGPASAERRIPRGAKRSKGLPLPRRRARRDRMRRWAAALLASAAVLVGLSAFTTAREQPPGLSTLVAARDLPAGHTMAAGDLLVTTRPSSQRPGTALAAYDDVLGRVTAGPVTARDVMTPERLVGADLLAGQPSGHVAVTLPVLPAATTGVGRGSRVDVYATGTGHRVASDVLVLGTSGKQSSTGGLGSDAGGAGVGTPLGTGSTSYGGVTVTVALDSSSAERVAASLSALQAGESLLLALRAR